MTNHPLIGKIVNLDFQPYGPVRFRVTAVRFRSYRDYRGKPGFTRDLTGEVIEGSETSRLFQHTSTKQLKPGSPYWLSGIDKRDARTILSGGRVVKIAM